MTAASRICPIQQARTMWSDTLRGQLTVRIKGGGFYKIVKNEFLALEDIPNIDDDMFVRAYNEAREHGGINGLTPSVMFLQRLITSAVHTTNKQQSATQVGNQKCNPCA